MNKYILTIVFSIFFFALIVSCKKLAPQAPEADTVMDAPIDGLTFAQNALFLKGSEEFDETYTTENGLGPIFVSNSCRGCHASDNRGSMFTVLTRFGQKDTSGNTFLHLGGPQIQNKAIVGHTIEQLPNDATSSKFIAPIVSGVGFLELVSDLDILAMADPNDLNGDGISGVPNWNSIPSWVKTFPNAQTKNGKFICKFGRKASVYNVHQQTVGAFNQDMGITTTFMPDNPMNVAEAVNSIPLSEPDLPDQNLNATVFYLQALQTPIQRNQNDPDVIKGKSIFVNLGCESCHKQNLKTTYSPIAGLSFKEFHPYTDLLLHDMGPGLDDKYTEGSATTSEWRTTPLWGLGLAKDSQGGELFLMHDGRARSIEDAILMHGGESEMSRNKFNNLSQAEKELVLKFLRSL